MYLSKMERQSQIHHKTPVDTIVLQLDNSSTSHFNLASASLLRDHFINTPIPSPDCYFSFSVLDLISLKFKVVSIQPNYTDQFTPLYATSTTRVYIIPATPCHLSPSRLIPFSFPESLQTGHYLQTFLRLSVSSPQCFPELSRNSISRPYFGIVHGSYGCGKSSVVSYITHQLDSTLIHLPANLIITKFISSQSLLNALLYYMNAAIATQPAVLVFDDCHFVFSKQNHQAAAAFVCMLEHLHSERKKSNGLQVAVVVVLSGPLDTLHPIIITRTNTITSLVINSIGEWAKDMVSKLTKVPFDTVNTFWPYQGFSTISEAVSWARQLKLDGDVLPSTKIINSKDNVFNGIHSENFEKRWCELSSQLGGLDEPQQVLKRLLLWRRTKRETFDKLNIKLSSGILLYGVPGTGKTALVQLAATATQFRIVSIDAASLARGEVGASERLLAEKFEKAESTIPCVVFIDEIDSLFHTSEGRAPHLQRLVAKLAYILDNIKEHIVVIGATNRPWAISRPLLRPGRFEHCVKVPLPNCEARKKIGAIYADKMKLDESAEDTLKQLASSFSSTGMSGADIAGACRRAAMRAYCRSSKIESEDLQSAFAETKPSVTSLDAVKLDQWRPDKQFNRKLT